MYCIQDMIIQKQFRHNMTPGFFFTFSVAENSLKTQADTTVCQ